MRINSIIISTIFLFQLYYIKLTKSECQVKGQQCQINYQCCIGCACVGGLCAGEKCPCRTHEMDDSDCGYQHNGCCQNYHCAFNPDQFQLQCRPGQGPTPISEDIMNDPRFSLIPDDWKKFDQFNKDKPMDTGVSTRGLHKLLANAGIDLKKPAAPGGAAPVTGTSQTQVAPNVVHSSVTKQQIVQKSQISSSGGAAVQHHSAKMEPFVNNRIDNDNNEQYDMDSVFPLISKSDIFVMETISAELIILVVMMSCVCLCCLVGLLINKNVNNNNNSISEKVQFDEKTENTHICNDDDDIDSTTEIIDQI